MMSNTKAYNNKRISNQSLVIKEITSWFFFLRHTLFLTLLFPSFAQVCPCPLTKPGYYGITSLYRCLSHPPASLSLLSLWVLATAILKTLSPVCSSRLSESCQGLRDTDKTSSSISAWWLHSPKCSVLAPHSTPRSDPCF